MEVELETLVDSIDIQELFEDHSGHICMLVELISQLDGQFETQNLKEGLSLYNKIKGV